MGVGGPSNATAGGGDATTVTDTDAGVRRTAVAPPPRRRNISACNGEAGGEGREGDESNKLTSRKLGGGEQQSKWRRPPVEKL